MARTERRFTFQRRFVTLWAWLMLFPNCGPLPQTSHTRAILQTPDSADFVRQGGVKSQDFFRKPAPPKADNALEGFGSKARSLDCIGTGQNHAIRATLSCRETRHEGRHLPIGTIAPDCHECFPATTAAGTALTIGTPIL